MSNETPNGRTPLEDIKQDRLKTSNQKDQTYESMVCTWTGSVMVHRWVYLPRLCVLLHYRGHSLDKLACGDWFLVNQVVLLCQFPGSSHQNPARMIYLNIIMRYGSHAEVFCCWFVLNHVHTKFWRFNSMKVVCLWGKVLDSRDTLPGCFFI